MDKTTADPPVLADVTQRIRQYFMLRRAIFCCRGESAVSGERVIGGGRAAHGSAMARSSSHGSTHLLRVRLAPFV